MARRKTPTAAAAATAGGVYLDDDEQLVEEVTTTKKIGRERRTPPSDDFITVEPEPPDDTDDEPASPQFGETSIAAVLFRDDDEPNYDDQFCTIAVRRNPDSMNDRFATPCTALTNLPPLRNVEITADKMDIEDRVRSQYGGGHYFFQIHFNNRLAASWKSTLSDLPTNQRTAEPAADRSVSEPATPAVAVDPFDTFLSNLEKQKRLRDLLFGDEQTRLTAEIERLKAEIAKTPAAAAEPKSEKLAMLEMALGLNKPELSDRVLNSIFPAEEEGSRHWLADTLSVVFENKDAIVGVLAGLLGGGTPPANTTNVMDMMRQQPPSVLPAMPAAAEKPPDVFPRRKAVTPDAPDAESENADSAAIDAEITEDTNDVKPKRKN